MSSPGQDDSQSLEQQLAYARDLRRIYEVEQAWRRELEAANQALAAANAELEKRFYDLLAAQDWILALTSTHTLPALIDALTQPLVLLLGARTVLVFPWDHTTGRLGTVLGYGLPTETPGLAALRTSALTATILEAGRLWEVADLQASSAEEVRDYGVAQALGWRALVGVPLQSRRERVGLLYVAWEVPHSLDERERMLVNLMAQHAAVAMVNAREREARNAGTDALP
jgi:transcriptional regulator with GAF, ATPase, and Fis domain